MFTEHASGAQRDRPELKATLDYLRAGDTLQSQQVELRCLPSRSTRPPAVAAIFHLFGALAAFERAVIRERTSAGLQAARARSEAGGRPTHRTARDLQMARHMFPSSTRWPQRDHRKP
ncbi:hypothetical protein F8S13_02955 [Chloroflexia bacterium SDU3-3]|nr:hypothetical protein F8S13_02955 [Chloroflexia bacterium SDU3-3]